MTRREKARLRRKWMRWLRSIQGDLADLLVSNDIAKGVRDIVNANRQIQSPATIHAWMRKNYAERVAVGIRRFSDRDKRSVSLHRLIDDIARHPRAIDRSYYVSRYSKRMRAIGAADRDFEQFANKAGDVVSPYKLKVDMNRLKRSTDRIRQFTNKWVAHCDLRQRRYRPPTYQDVDTALDDIDKLFCKYYMLLTTGGLMSCKPALAFDWEDPLRYPWILDRHDTECGPQ